MKKVVFLSLLVGLVSLLSVEGRAQAEKSSENVFRVDFYQLDKSYPRFQFEGYSVFNSGIGLWCLGEYAQPVIRNEWVAKGYILPPEEFNFSLNLGLTYNIGDDLKIIGGIGAGAGKRYFGPLAGLRFKSGRISFDALGVYATITAFKSEYSEEYLQKYTNLNYGKPIYIRGFDPNSWYRASILYSVTDNFEAGVVSERFYLTGITVGYGKEISSDYVKSLKLKASIGRNFEFSVNGLSIGMDIGLF